jgi:hypothetical protein
MLAAAEGSRYQEMDSSETAGYLTVAGLVSLDLDREDMQL